jgi:XTP/dITP diphosphohydrolase
MIKREKLNYRVYSLEDFPEIPEIVEDGTTFKENALKKASMVAQYTGFLTIADDSGLEVDYLGGAPGIYSARFAGEPKSDRRNNQKLLKLMQGVPMDKRTARFRCVIAIVTISGENYITEGVCEGIIAKEPHGEGGFGFDPLFYLPEYKKTMAELDAREKNRISHRAKAFQGAVSILKTLNEKK